MYTFVKQALIFLAKKEKEEKIVSTSNHQSYKLS